MIEYEGKRYYSFSCPCSYCCEQTMLYMEKLYPLPSVLPREIRMRIISYANEGYPYLRYEDSEQETSHLLSAAATKNSGGR